MSTLNLGKINGHIVGRFLKETMRRAMQTIRKERSIFEAQAKRGYTGDMNDVFTSADTKAQAIYRRAFEECLPNCGIIGEEKDKKTGKPLVVRPKNGCTAYFTVDPLDGTKAYVRRQSHGVGSMVAMVDKGEVIAAYVGDVNSDEVYGYRPDSDKVFRISQLDSFEQLGPGKKLRHFADAYIMLRDPLSEYSVASAILTDRFKNYEVMGSSIGTWAARLWKGEVQALLIQPGMETPWDSTPVIGISKKLGYVHMRPKRSTGLDGDTEWTWEVYEPELVKKVTERDHDTLIIHKRNVHLVNKK